jgi:carotenoid cleavage dioxygenase-like enzyme
MSPRGNPFLSGPWAPVTEERTALGLDASVGAIPPELAGIFVRTGPNPRFPSRLDPRSYHFFSGNGMVHGVELLGGKAHYRNRWVRTRRVRRDESTAGATVGDPPPAGDHGYGMGNTAMLYHGGRCLALDEGTQGAWQLRLPSLETVGFFNWSDRLRHRFTAHPKICSASGELHFFGYGPHTIEGGSAAHIHYSAAAASGELLPHGPRPVPFRRPVMAHDMALSRRHAIFFDLPLWDMAAPVDTSDLTRIAIMDREEPGNPPRWFECRGCYGYHTANAWDEPSAAAAADGDDDGQDVGAVEIIYCSSERFDFRRSNADSLFLHRWRLELGSGKVTADEDLCPVRFALFVGTRAHSPPATSPPRLLCDVARSSVPACLPACLHACLPACHAAGSV